VLLKQKRAGTMPIPKALVTRREEMNYEEEDCQGETSPSPFARRLVSSADDEDDEEEEEERATQSSSPIMNHPSKTAPMRKKRVGVKWKDLSSDVPAGVEGSAAENKNIDDFQEDFESEDDDCDANNMKQSTTCGSPSPSSSLTLLELEQHILKQESSIRRACELELKLLNQCTRVREKRSLMVQRLRRMKRKMQKLANEDKWTARTYSFPPEYDASKPSSKTPPLMIDMTQTESMEDAATGTS
jgi:hypothetical protein